MMSIQLFSVLERVSSFRRNVLVMGREHAVVEFAKRNNFIEKKGSKTASGGSTSHHMYGGLYGLGRLCVPQAETRALAAAIVNDFSYGVYSALTENKPAGLPTRFYIDYDLSFSSLGEAADFEKLWLLVEAVQQEELAKFFPAQVEEKPDFFDCMVLSGGLIETKDALKPFKAGVHVIFKHVFVTVDMALYITAHIIHRLERDYLGTADSGAWAKRIDQNVYAEGRGLRWAWQLKTKPCPRCNGAGFKAECSSCRTGEVIDERASMYTPVYTCSGVYSLRREPVPPCRDSPTVELLLACSLRAVSCLEPSHGFTLYPGHLPLPVFTRGGGAGKHPSVAPSGDRATSARNTEDLLPKADERFAVIAAAVKRVHREYASIEIQKIKTHAYGFAVAVLGIGSCFCMNYGKDHAKQRVSFFVGRAGVTQSCYCKCDVVRDSGIRCRDYKSAKTPLTEAETAKLFPAAVLKKTATSAAAAAAVLATESVARTVGSEKDFFHVDKEDTAAMRLAISKANTLARSGSEITQQYTNAQMDELVAKRCLKLPIVVRAKRFKTGEI